MANYYTDNKNLRFHLEHPLMEKIVRLKEQNYIDKEKYDYAPLDYEDTIDSYDKVLEIVGEISGDIIGPNAESVDHDGPKIVNNEVVYAPGTQKNLEAIVNAGLFGMSLPREFGGLNFAMVPYVMAAEIVSRSDAGFANIWGLQDCAETIHEFASEEIKREFLPRFAKGATAAMDLTEPDAGSDLQAVQLKATWDEAAKVWRLNGVKRFITNGDAHVSLVLARSEEGTSDARGLSLFVYDRASQAMTVRRIENKLGIKGSPTCELVFNNAPAHLIGDRKMGLIKYVMSLMNSARLGVGAQSVGIAEAAYREAVKYAHEREQFGKAIVNYPAVYEMLTLMKVRTDAIRSLLYETARFVDVYKAYNIIAETRKLDADERNEAKSYQKLADVFTPLLKLFSSEYCNQIAYDSLQIHGGTGFMKDFPIERIYRDARITTIYEGTSQLQVVAAIRGVTSGLLLKVLRDYAGRNVHPEQEPLRRVLISMTDRYEQAVSFIEEFKDGEYTDFHARRLVELAGNIVMGYLLLDDCQRDDSFERTANIFITKVNAENLQHENYIKTFNPKELGEFKAVFEA
ncbi:MAG TPA: acyl-CoA dehydrogenase [Bacteroidales bacterium]|nr:MAG: acyl-CoA dehydrogenase [Bacteroidetes bacterium GWE2_42_24]HBZ67412.1 acyl-CoA dehydrogenase [Bacteroidales bacterium]